MSTHAQFLWHEVAARALDYGEPVISRETKYVLESIGLLVLCLTLLLSVADLVRAESRIASGCFAFLQQAQAAAAATAMSDDWDEGETTTSVSGSARPAVCAFCALVFRGFLVVLFAGCVKQLARD